MSDDPYAEIESLASILNCLQFDDNATMCFNLFCDALVWSDEWPRHTGHDDWMCRYLALYRTSVIEGKPVAALVPYWEAAKKAFPKWPGFAECRCQPSESLRAQIATLRRKAEEDFDEAFE